MQAWIVAGIILVVLVALALGRRRRPWPALREAALAEDALCAHIKAQAAGYNARGFARMPTIRRAVRELREAYRYCASLQNTLPLTPASQWLCDNVRMLEEAAVSVNEALQRGPRLPASNGITRVTALAREIISHSDAHIDQHLLTACATAWQQAQPLTEAELWALPLALRRALVMLAGEIARDCVSAERARVRAQHWAARMHGANGSMPAAFNRETHNTAFLERLLTLLLENEDSAGLSSLDAHLQQLDTTAERVAANEHSRQTRARDWMGNAVGSLRRLVAMDWQVSLEALSTSDAWLRQDPAEVYTKMDFSSRCLYRTRAARIARVCKVPEAVVARRAVACATQGAEALTRHVGYYLIDEGLPTLWEALGGAPFTARLWRLITQRASWLYMGSIVFFDVLITIILAFCGLPWWVLAVAIMPIGEGVRQLLSLLITRATPPRRLPRIAPEHIKDRTLVVVPTLLTSRAHALEMVRHLSVLRFANPEGMIDYMLLADFTDNADAEKPEDAGLTQAALEAIEALNQVWGGGYYYMHRKRVWDAAMGRYLGHERKRGALEALNEWIVDGFSDTPMAAVSFDPRILHARYRHVVTLDADTRLPPDSALALSGTLAHPLNTPCEHLGKLRGHAVIQPRMEVAAGTVRTHLGRLYGGDGGVDLYVTAYAELYHNLAAAGSFAGKGVYDPVAFQRAVKGRIRKGAILSHDLLEGVLSRASLACDITLYDGQPATLLAWMKRQHRWTRGDWQLLPWLFPKVEGTHGKFRNPLDGLSRFKIYENLRRSLLPVVSLLLLLGGFLTGSLSAIILALLPGNLGSFLPPSKRSLSVLFIRLALLPYECSIQLDAILRTLWRVLVSKKRMLEWVTSAESEKQNAPSSNRRFWPILPASLLALAGSLFHPWFLLIALPLSAAWLTSPRLNRWLDSPAWPKETLDESQRDMLQALAGETWRFFTDSVSSKTHFLPPDNVQVEPARGAAPRTSPTNIGMYLLSCSAAHRLGLIGAQEMCERIAATVATMERLETWRGHLLNWYDIRTLKPLQPHYVSAVDSGNMAVCLIAVAQAVRGVFNEISPDLQALPSRLEALVDRISFQALYDPAVSLFYIGVDVSSGQHGDSHYDLLASESRMLSYLAIMRREVPLRHWRALGRTMTATQSGPTLLSWGGTSFEYLMPLLMFKHVPGTLLGLSCHHATLAQIHAAPGKPWGVSESGFWAFDPELNYQYRAFGLPQLSLRSGAPQPVIAPYASALALQVAPRAAAQNLAYMRQLGWADAHGLYEAADYDRARIPKEREYMLVRSHMAHHQGMILCSICNQLCNDALIRDFHGLPQAEAYTLLLEECLPTRRMLSRAVRPRYQAPVPTPVHARRTVQRDALPVQTHLMHGNGTTLMYDQHGNGYIAHQGVMLTRWRPDPALTGNGPQCWLCLSGQWLALGGSDGALVFESGRVLWSKRIDDLDIELECGVSPLDGGATCLITLRNHGTKPIAAELCSFAEVALSSQAADTAHPAFRNLSIEIKRPQPQLLLAQRRPRTPNGHTPYLAHIISVEGAPEIQAEGDRAEFLGREGGLPRALRTGFNPELGTIGAVVDPCVSLRTRLHIAPDAQTNAAFIYAAADTAEDALALAAHYAHPEAAHRALQLASTQAEVSARYLNMDAAQQISAQSLAAYLLYHGQPAGRLEMLEDNTLPLSGLWPMGLSGDLSILTLRIEQRSAMPMVRTLLRCHEYLRQLGLWFDLVFLCCHESGYNQPIRDALREAIAASPARDLTGQAGGVHLLDAQTLSSQSRSLLHAASVLTLNEREGGLQAQLAALRRTLPPPSHPWSLASQHHRTPRLTEEALLLDNGFGGFDAKAAYVIHPGKTPPAPWCNVLANPSFGMILTERGSGFTWAGNSNLRRLTPFLNDPVRDRCFEALYLRDEESGIYWSPTPAPCGSSAPIRVRHGQGYSLFETNGMGLTQRLHIFVDPEQPIACRMLTLTNHGGTIRHLSLTAFVQWSLRGAGETRLLHRGRQDGTVWVRHPAESQIAYVAIPGQTVTHTTDALAFLGSHGPEHPRGMSLPELDDIGGEMPCAALRCTFTLIPGQELTLCMLLGQAESLAQASEQQRLYAQPLARLDAAKALWDRRLGHLRINTPDVGLNLLLERWLPYQATAARLWARAGFYQAGGAIGFRDQLQDMLILLYTHPQEVRAHLLDAAAHQFEDGDVQHWWHPPALGVRTRISDDKLFLPFMAAQYIAATGDRSILEETAPYLRNHPIPDGAEDWFGEAERSDASGSLHEHCLRALDHVTLGEHGLPLIGCGDWNDAMSHIGPEGRGESIWLGFFYIVTLRAYAALCDEPTQQRLTAHADMLLQNAEAHAWDGGWYRRAWFDDGQVIGSVESPECQIDCIAQSWSVLAGAMPERREQAMHAVLTRLADEALGIVKLLDPPFDGALFPGYIRGYLPGVRENGGQYTHGAVWSVLACLNLGWTDEAWALYQRMLPIWHSRNETEARRYRVEPYVAVADIYANPQQAGRGGWTWYTGAAAWLGHVGIQGLLGMQKRGERIRLHPTAPKEWTKGYELSYRWGKATYRLCALNGITQPTLDGNPLPDGWITLVDDGLEHIAQFPITDG